jgi:hypothetical protein
VSAGPRQFAATLAALDDPTLAALFAARRVSPTAPWRDFFDAAEGLTDEASLVRALEQLTADELGALEAALDPAANPHHAGGHDAAARRLALTDAEGRPLPPVQRLLAARAGASAPHASHPARPATPAAEGAAAERAFTSVAALGDVIIQALHTPLSRIGSGALGAADRRRIADDLTRPEDLDTLVSLAERAGLLSVEGRVFLPTPAGEDWLAEGTTRRWALVARRWSEGLARGLHTESGWVAPEEWPLAYPADPAWPELAGALRAQARVWGLVAADDTLPRWMLLMPHAADDAEAALAALLPREVDRIYLQNDLTAISPGPLAAGLDVRLRRMARRESHAQASTYRFTADSVAAALTEGETEPSMLEFLTALSLTGVPQPLEYLVRTTSESHGLVRVAEVSPDSTGASRTVVRSPDAQVLETIAVDQALRPLGLVRTDDGSALTTRVGRNAVLWALVDARYPAVAVDAHGAIEPLTRHRLAAGPAPHPDPQVAYAPLIAVLRGADSGDADAAWMGRELESAVRARGVLEVEVALPGGETRVFTLEATGLGGGRLRGRERGTDVERTLPVSSIRGIRRH